MAPFFRGKNLLTTDRHIPVAEQKNRICKAHGPVFVNHILRNALKRKSAKKKTYEINDFSKNTRT